MQQRKVTITYLDNYGVWGLINKDIHSYFPMRNLAWNSLQQNTCIISELDVCFKPYNPDEVHTAPVSLYLPPFLNLYVVACDDRDTYRQLVRPQIKEWHDVVTLRRPQEWLIVYVSRQDVKNTSSFMNLRASVYDQIRTEFSTGGKRERCVALRLFDGELRDGDTWNAFMENFKECVMHSFEQHVMQYEEVIRRLDAQRQMPGWNFCTFFLLKESMAQAYEAMNLIDEALMVYDELDASFFQIQKDRTLNWFRQFGGREKGDDSLDPFNGEVKPFRKLIMDNQISLFDMHIYLFAMQSHLLLLKKQPMEMIERAYRFLMSFQHSIRLNKKSLLPCFEESWLYTTSMAIGKICQQIPPDARKVPHYYFMLTELLYLARKQLDKIGMYSKQLPQELPFSVHLPVAGAPAETLTIENAEELGCTNADLIKAIESSEHFDDLYISISKNAYLCYLELGRDKCLWMLEADLASLYHHRGRYSEAAELFTKLCNRYQRAGWSSIERFLRIKLSECHKQLGQVKEYIDTALHLLQTPQELKGLEKVMAEDIIVMSGQIEEVTKPFEPLFQVSILSKVETNAGEVGIEILVTNHLTQDIRFDCIRLKMLGSDLNELIFSSMNGSLSPGENSFALKCENIIAGNYVADNITMKLGGLLFINNFSNEESKPVFRISPYASTLKADVSVSQYEGKNRILIRLNTKNHSVSSGFLKLLPMSAILSINQNEPAYYITNEGEKFVLTKKGGEFNGESTYVLPTCPADGLLQFYIPYSAQQLLFSPRIRITVDYETEEGKNYTLVESKQLDMSNPVSIHHSIKVMADHVLIHVKVVSETDIPIRLIGQVLNLPTGYKLLIQGQSSELDAILFPQETYTFLYKIAPMAEFDGPLGDNAEFEINFTSLQDEAMHYIAQILSDMLKQAKLEAHTSFILDHIDSFLLTLLDFNTAATTDVLSLSKVPLNSFETVLLHETTSTKKAILDVVKSFFQEYAVMDLSVCRANTHASFRKVAQHILAIPESELVTEVNIQPVSTLPLAPLEIVTEQACSYELCLCQYYHSGGRPKAEDEVVFSEVYLEVLDDRENWLVCGKKRARVPLTPSERKTFALTVVPLKTGTLPLPQAQVSYLSSSVPNTSVKLTTVSTAVVLPKSRGASFFLDVCAK